MRTIPLLLLMVALAGMAQAQIAVPSSTDESARQRQQRYRETFTALNQRYQQTPNNVEVLVLLAQFYADTTYPSFNLPLAMDYISRAEKQYITYINTNELGEMRSLLRKGIKLETIRKQKQQIRRQAEEIIDSENSLSDIEIARYTESFHNDNALSLEMRKQRVETAYRSTVKQGTIDAYYLFEQEYPNTAEYDSAEIAIAKICPTLFDRIETESETDAIAARYGKSSAVQQAALRHKTQIAYNAARAINTVQAYRQFLSSYPASEQYFDALDAMGLLLQNHYENLHSTKELIEFIKTYSDNEMADDAMNQLILRIRKDKDVEAAKAYLAEFPLDQHYNDIYKLFYEWHAAEGNLQPIKAFAQAHPDYPYQTTLQADLKEGAAIDSFNLMRPYVESHHADYVSFIRHHTGKKIAFVALQRILQSACAKRDWKTASERMGDVMLSFEEVSADDFNTLRAMFNAPANPNAPTLTPHYKTNYQVIHPVSATTNGYMYFTALQGQETTIMRTLHSDSRNPWSQAEPISFTNADNSGMTIYGLYDNDRKMILGKDGDIWIAEADGEQWRISEIPPYPVNTDYTETDAYMLPDGTGLLLASDRPGGYNLQASRAIYHGDTALATDIYFIPRTIGGWGTPINLGSQVNTTCAERSPLLSRNQKTLFFISDGHGGQGYGDIYMTTRANADKWNEWSEVVNLGREANTTFDEASISFANDESQLIVSSNQRQHHYDAYTVATTHNATNPNRTVQINARRLGRSLAQIDIADYTLQALVQEIIYPNSEKLIDLNLYRGKRYVVYAKANGYYVPPIIIDTQSNQTIVLNAYLTIELLKQKEPMPLLTVRYEKEELHPQSIGIEELDRLADFLRSNTTLNVELVINAQEGDMEGSYDLSLRRGQHLRRYLSNHGVDAQRIEVSAQGKSAIKPHKAWHQVLIKFHSNQTAQ